MSQKEGKDMATEEPVFETEAQGRDLVEIPLIGVQLPRPMVPWLIAALAAMLLLGWSFLRGLPATWFDEEGYYSHGLLIPFMTLAAIYMRRGKIRSAEVGSSAFGLVIMVIGLALLIASRTIDNLSLAALAFILALAGGVYFAFGKQIGRLCLGPIVFLVFMMPVLGWAIDTYTNPLQRTSTIVSSKMLNVIGYQTEMSPAQPTTIHMNSYTMHVGGPCSGFKLILSLVAFTSFFVMISGLGWKKNLFLFALTLPLALAINGLRIMFIGLVGENRGSSFSQWLANFGDDPGMVFHDYSGYITLIICFIILHFIVRALEGGKQPIEDAS